MRLRCFTWPLAVSLSLLGGEVEGATSVSALEAQGDAAFSERAALRDAEGRADPREVRRAAKLYRAAIAEEPGHLEAHWKFLRALHFEVEFTSASVEEKQTALELGIKASKAALVVLALRAGGEGLAVAGDVPVLRRLYPPGLRRDAARIHFFSALVWGGWSRTSGVLEAIREGVTWRLRGHARVVVALEPQLDGGGGHRFLANLHARLPRVPFLTSWVDRDQALSEARHALEIDPDHPGNRLLLALLRLDLENGSRDDALAELRTVASLAPRPDEVAEDLAIRRAARERLAKESDRAVRAGNERPTSTSAPSRAKGRPRAGAIAC